MLKRKPYVYHIRDLYLDMAVGGSIVEPGILTKIWKKLHRWALRICSGARRLPGLLWRVECACDGGMRPCE
jgi:hypothetical protein